MTCLRRHSGKAEVAILTLDEDGWSASCPGHFTPGKIEYPLYKGLGESWAQSGLAQKNLATTGT
jgi:hypothetical protein